MRIFLGFLVAGLALGGAVWLHSAKLEHQPPRCLGGTQPVGDHCGRGRYTSKPVSVHTKAGWQDPLAVVLAFAGVGAGVALVVSGLRPRAS